MHHQPQSNERQWLEHCLSINPTKAVPVPATPEPLHIHPAVMAAQLERLIQITRQKRLAHLRKHFGLALGSLLFCIECLI